MVAFQSSIKHISSKGDKKILFITLIAVIIAEDFIIYYAPMDYRFTYTNYILIINSSVAAGFAIIVLSRERFEGIHAKINLAIAIGLILWLCANITWTIYENILDIPPPVLSFADCFWLAAYPFFVYSLYMKYKEFHKKLHGKKVILISLCTSVIFIVCMVFFTVNNLSVFTTLRGVAMYSVIIAYPVLNAILIVPAIILLTVFRKEKDWSVPWICESISLLSLIVADSWFAIIFLTHLLPEEIWYSNLFLIDHYIVISGGLIWYIKFLIPANHNGYSSKSIVFRKFGYKIPKRIPFVASIIAIIIISSTALNSTFGPFSHVNPNVLASLSNKNTEIIKIGILIGLSGISSQRGESQKAAIEIAVDDVNHNLSKVNKSIRVVPFIEDTQRNPDIALEKLKSLADKGIRIVIGPQTSAELNKVKGYANKNNILLISYSSTATSLAIAKDNIFRFVQNDSYQADVIARQMYKDKIKVVVPIWRNDTYGHDLYTSMKNKFEKLGGIVYHGIAYHPPIGKFAASLHRINFIMWDQDLKTLSSRVNEAKHDHPNYKVAIYIIAFDEIVPILIQAQNHDMLDEVNWYGSDGSAKNELILKNFESAKFANKARFLNPLSGVEENDSRVKILENKIEEKISRYPDPYYANAYDALWVAALTENATKGIKDIQTLKQKLYEMANSYFGLTGKTSLDEDGDRKYGTYDFWIINEKDDNKGYEWVKVKNSSSIQLNTKMN